MEIYNKKGQQIPVRNGQIVPAGAIVRNGQIFENPLTQAHIVVITRGQWHNGCQAHDNDTVELKKLSS